MTKRDLRTFDEMMADRHAKASQTALRLVPKPGKTAKWGADRLLDILIEQRNAQEDYLRILAENAEEREDYAINTESPYGLSGIWGITGKNR